MTRTQRIGGRVIAGVVVGAFLAIPLVAAGSVAGACVGLAVAVWWVI